MSLDSAQTCLFASVAQNKPIGCSTARTRSSLRACVVSWLEWLAARLSGWTHLRTSDGRPAAPAFESKVWNTRKDAFSTKNTNNISQKQKKYLEPPCFDPLHPVTDHFHRNLATFFSEILLRTFLNCCVKIEANSVFKPAKTTCQKIRFSL